MMVREMSIFPNSKTPLRDRIQKAMFDFSSGRASMHIPAEETDADIVLADCREEIERLTRELAEAHVWSEALEGQLKEAAELYNSKVAENAKLREALKQIRSCGPSEFSSTDGAMQHMWVLAESALQSESESPKGACNHERLNEDGICRACGKDRRGI